MGMTGFDSRSRYLNGHIELAYLVKLGKLLRANVLSRAKNALARAFAVPSLAPVVA